MPDNYPKPEPGLPVEGRYLPVGELETRLRRAARMLPYPPTPDLAASARDYASRLAARRPQRTARLGWALALVILAAGLLLVPGVRAQVVEWIRLGAVRIFLPGEDGLEPTATLPAGITAQPTENPLPPEALLDLAGRTSLAGASQQVDFTLRLPPELGEPQHVYFQEIQGDPVVITVWVEPGAPQTIRAVLYQVGSDGLLFDKRLVEDIQETTVDGQAALWVRGRHTLQTDFGETVTRRLVEGHTLIWEEDGITYRFESAFPLEEARRLAASLAPWEQ